MRAVSFFPELPGGIAHTFWTLIISREDAVSLLEKYVFAQHDVDDEWMLVDYSDYAALIFIENIADRAVLKIVTCHDGHAYH